MSALTFVYVNLPELVSTPKAPSKRVRSIVRYKVVREQYKSDIVMWHHIAGHELQKSYDTATGGRWTPVNYVFEPISGLPRTVFRGGVYPKGWRRHSLTFQAPGRFSSRRKLELLVSGLRTGLLRFEPADPAEVALVVEYFQIDWTAACAARDHSLEIRDLRPLATRSGLLRKGTTNKTAEEVDDPEDTVENRVWPDDVTRAMCKMMDVPYPPPAVKAQAWAARKPVRKIKEPVARVTEEVEDEIEEWE